MLRSIIWYIDFVFSLILTIPQFLKAKKLAKGKDRKEFDKYVYTVTYGWALSRLKMTGSKVTVHNEDRIPKDRNVLFVSNHQGNFDIPILMSMIKKPKGFVSKIELLHIPFISTWMKHINCVFIDRHDLKQSLQTILEGIKILKAGYSLVIFPEGTRSKSNKVGEFKLGSFKLAIKSKVPIVPITIDGSYKIMESNNCLIKPANINLYVHEPIYIESLSKDDINKLHETVKAIIEKPLLNKK